MSSFQDLMITLSNNNRVNPRKVLIKLSQNPRNQVDYTKEENREDLVELIVKHHRRLQGCIQHVQNAPPSEISEDLKDRFAQHLVEAIAGVMPDLCNMLVDVTVSQLIASVLEFCVPRKIQRLQKLATSLKDETKILQHLYTGEFTGHKIFEWVSDSAQLMSQDQSTIGAWARIAVDMAGNCLPDSHGIKDQVDLFNIISSLCPRLEQLRCDFDARTRLSQVPMPSTGGKPISKGGRAKSSSLIHPRLATRPAQTSLDLPEDVASALRKLGFAVPNSSRTLQNVIEDLQVRRQSDVLGAVGRTFPCARCYDRLSELSPTLSSMNRPQPDLSSLKIRPAIFGKFIGNWKVLLSEPALKSFQSMDHPESVKARLEDLSMMRAESKPARGTEGRDPKRFSVPPMEIDCDDNIHILWQVEVGLNPLKTVWQQEIKVWEIGKAEKIAKKLHQVAALQASYSRAKIGQCNVRDKNAKSERDILPLTFSSTEAESGSADKDSVSTHLAGDRDGFGVRMLDPETIQLANKFHVLTEPMIRAVMAHDVAAQFPLDISREEVKIINHVQSSSLIIGRSGTGKTTCLVYKMVAKFLASQATDKQNPVRQVLMTRSTHLAEKLRIYTTQLIKTIQRGSCLESVQVSAESQKREKAMLQSAKESALSLQDHSFPLICTFDGFLQILENTVAAMDRQNFAVGQDSNLRTHLVTYESFRLDYWPAFPTQLTKNLSAAVVFSEIMGVIKGFSSLAESFPHMEKEAYVKKSGKQSSNLTESEREKLYTLFKHYETLRLEKGQHDYVDRVMKILKAIRGNSALRKFLSSTFDEVYVDEVQDQKTIDIELFLSFISDCRGFHFAGDTAQAIAQDSTFRFTNVSALIYKHFELLSTATNQPLLAKPALFTLARNYRSHQRILRLASLAMDLIWKGYPETVDKLDPEVGELFGPLPIIFLGCGAEILTKSKAGDVKLHKNSAEFGAEQVILVRDDNAKQHLKAQIGDTALVLTIAQSKGMEFDDVVLWDFFSQCPNSPAIRKIQDLLSSDTAAAYAKRYPDMCTELKNLYVALTRARIQLFFIESSEKTMRPICELLRDDDKVSLVDLTRADDPAIAGKLSCLRPGGSADPQRWSLRGDQFMQNLNYTDAILCFGKAGNLKKVSHAEAELHAETGRILKAPENVHDSFLAFEQAYQKFVELDLIPRAVSMLENMDQFSDAARLSMDHGFYEHAATLFLRVQDWLKAATCFERTGNFKAAAAALRSGGEYDKLVEMMVRNKSEFEQAIYKDYVRVFRPLLKKTRISKTHNLQAISLIGSLPEQESFLRDYDMHTELIQWYNLHGRHTDAFYLELRLGTIEAAWSTAVKYRLTFPDSGIPESQLISLLDYIMIGKVVAFLNQGTDKPGLDPSDLSPEHHAAAVANRFSQWSVALRILPWNSCATALQEFDLIKDGSIKILVSLLNIFYADIVSDCSGLAALPYVLLKTGTDYISNIVFEGSSSGKTALLMACGICTTELFKDGCAPFKWSPITEMEPANGVLAAFKLQYFAYEKLSSAILDFQSKALVLRGRSVKNYCFKFVANGSCRDHLQQKCLSRIHEMPSTEAYRQNLESLLDVAEVLCGWTRLYYRRVLPEKFQKTFLSMRRRWLEWSMRELQYSTALKQDFPTLSQKRSNIAKVNMPKVTIAAMEDLLFYRIRTEWQQRRWHYQLLEDIQFAELLGPKISSRFHSILSLNIGRNQEERRQAFLSRQIKQAATGSNLQDLETILERGLRNTLLDPQKSYNGSLSCVITELESLASFLIIKNCSHEALLPVSWIAGNPSLLSQKSALTTNADSIQKRRFLRLQLSLGQTISKFFSKPPRFSSLGGPIDLLRQRNAELLALIWVNLYYEDPSTFSMTDSWREAVKTFHSAFYCNAYDSNRNLNSPWDLYGILRTSFSRYKGRNYLVVLIKVAGSPSHNNFSSSSDIKAVKFEDLQTLWPSPSSGKTMQENDEQHSEENLQSVLVIQKFWRKWFLKFRRHQLYMQTPEAQMAGSYISLGPQPFTKVAIRAILVTKGPETQQELSSLKLTVSPLRESVIQAVQETEDSDARYNALDDALRICGNVEEELAKVSGLISDDRVQALVQDGIGAKLSQTFSNASEILQAANDKIKSVRELLIQ